MVIKQLHTTINIANKDFNGMRRFVARFNFLCTLIGHRPQSLTAILSTVGIIKLFSHKVN